MLIIEFRLDRSVEILYLIKFSIKYYLIRHYLTRHHVIELSSIDQRI
jgi:hypothetical protein